MRIYYLFIPSCVLAWHLAPISYSNLKVSLLSLFQPATTALYSVLSWLLQEWQPLTAAGRGVISLFKRRQPDGLFEVLDYDSTLELLDGAGHLAIFKRRQKVRFLQDHIMAFQDYAWGDGDVLADYRIAPGEVVDCYREGERWNILISLRETKNRGDSEEFHIERTVRDGFTQDVEWRQTAIWLTTKRARLEVDLPQGRSCRRVLLLQRSTNRTIELDGEHVQWLPDGRQMIAWEKQNPPKAEVYTIRWEW